MANKKISAFDPVTDDNIDGSESLGGVKGAGNVKVTIQQISNYHDRGEWDASGNLFPTQRGNGDVSNVKKNDEWLIVGAGSLGDTSVVEANKLSLKALYDNPQQDESKWKIY